MAINPMDLLYKLCFAAFVHKAFEILYPGKKLNPNWHIDAVCHYIQEMVEGRKPKHLVLNMPPRSLKTFIVSNCLPAWLLARDPSMEVIVASYADRLSGKGGRDFRVLVESDFVIQLSRGELAEVRKSTETEYETIQGGGCYWTSVGGTLTGRGADFIVIDDPMKAGEATSAVALRTVNDWFRDTLYSRRNRPINCPVVLSMQRLHMDDLAGMLIENGWPSLVFPAIAVEDEIFDLGGGAKHHRRKDDLLQPNWDTLEALDQSRKMHTTYIFSAQYQQNPLPAEGNRIKREWIKWYKQPPSRDQFRQIYVTCDPSGKDGPHNDYTAIAVLGVAGRNVYGLDVRRGHWSGLQIKDNLVAIFEQWNPTQIIIETTGLGEGVRQEINRDGRYYLSSYQPKLDKRTRLERVIMRFESGQFFLPEDAPWLPEFSEELLSFPETRYDDQVDAVIIALEDLLECESWYQDLSGLTFRYESIEDQWNFDQFSNR